MQTLEAPPTAALTPEQRDRMTAMVHRIRRTNEERPRKLGWHESLGSFILGLIADDCQTLVPWHTAFLAGSSYHETELPKTTESGVRLLGEIAFAGCMSTEPTSTRARTDQRLDDIERDIDCL